MNEKEIPIEVDPPDAPIDGTPNEDRSPEEIDKWWGVPFIVTDTFEDIGDPDYETYVDRLSDWPNIKITDRETWEAKRAEFRKQWYEWFPSGTRYWIKCLNGGAWDRPTEYETFGTLDEAVEYARNM